MLVEASLQANRHDDRSGLRHQDIFRTITHPSILRLLDPGTRAWALKVLDKGVGRLVLYTIHVARKN